MHWYNGVGVGGGVVGGDDDDDDDDDYDGGGGGGGGDGDGDGDDDDDDDVDDDDDDDDDSNDECDICLDDKYVTNKVILECGIHETSYKRKLRIEPLRHHRYNRDGILLH